MGFVGILGLVGYPSLRCAKRGQEGVCFSRMITSTYARPYRNLSGGFNNTGYCDNYNLISSTYSSSSKLNSTDMAF